MLPRLTMCSLVTAGVWTLLGLTFAVAEQAAPKAATPPQQGKAKLFPAPQALDTLRIHVAKNWTPPASTTNPEEVIVTVRFSLTPEGRLAAVPKVTSTGTTERYLKAREAAVRAIYRAQPFTMLLSVPHELWKEMEMTFDPRSMGKR